MAEYIIPAVSAILVAVLGAVSTSDLRKRKALDARAEARALVRTEESLLSMEMMSAAIDLGLATALAVEGQKINGEMRRAREKAARAQEEYESFLKRVASRQVAK